VINTSYKYNPVSTADDSIKKRNTNLNITQFKKIFNLYEFVNVYKLKNGPDSGPLSDAPRGERYLTHISFPLCGPKLPADTLKPGFFRI
jgi:hypothetical protein